MKRKSMFLKFLKLSLWCCECIPRTFPSLSQWSPLNADSFHVQSQPLSLTCSAFAICMPCLLAKRIVALNLAHLYRSEPCKGSFKGATRQLQSCQNAASKAPKRQPVSLSEPFLHSGAGWISQALKEHTNERLVELDLGYNEIKDEGACAVAQVRMLTVAVC